MKLSVLLNCFVAKLSWKSGTLSHLYLSKLIWKDVLKEGGTVIDATCGNGHDSLELAKLVLSPTAGTLHCIDIQQQAISNTQERLSRELPFSVFERVRFHCQSHETFPREISRNSVALVNYNLGYLPGSPRNDITNPIITRLESTVPSLEKAVELIQNEGLLCVTAYPSHTHGDDEALAVSEFFSTLDPLKWKAHSYLPVNRSKSPQLFLALKRSV
jgi:16S rRNA C1402 N4-methylase RsmH